MTDKAQQIYKKSLETLEFNKILDSLSKLCISEEAKELCLQLMPSSEAQKINKTLKQSDDAKSMVLRHGLPEFGSVHNIKASLKRAQVGAALSPKELLDIGSILKASRKLIKYFENFEESPMLSEHFSNIEKLPELENKIFDSILSPEEISDNASPELHTIRRRINALNVKVRDVLQNIIHSTKYQKYLQEPIITVRNERFVVPVKAEYKNEINGLVHDTSSSGATLFIEPMSVVDINNEIKINHAKEKDEIERILLELSALVSLDSLIIEKNYYHIVRLDFIYAKARLALYQNANMPKLSDGQSVNFIKARHPLIDKKSVVEVDIELGQKFDTLIITGPNTGGKTVALKTLGLLTAMAMAGLLIPCREGSEVGVFEYIFADIGDEQSIEQNLSTFSSHMSNIINIVENANSNTMVLFDELGAGTDPVEGAALAISILEYVHGFGAKIAATTHYSELKIYALSTKGVENASCEFDVATLKPTYKLLIGVPGKSNAFAISKRLGLSDYIIENAKKRLSQESLNFEEVLADLEKNRQQMQKERQRANQALMEVEQLKRDIQNLDKKHEEQRNKLLSQAKEEAASILERARSTSDQVLKELDELKKRSEKEIADLKLMESRAALRGKIKAAQSGIDDMLENKIPVIKGNIDRPLEVGDTVKIIKLNKEATVLERPQGGKVILQAGIMKVTVNIDELELVDNKKKSKPDANKYISKRNFDVKTREVKTEIDIRGYNIEEAIYEIDNFIDQALLLNLNKIQIIHGKGTGVLRSGVHAHLRGHKSISSFRLGTYGEGESGVTIVELK